MGPDLCPGGGGGIDLEGGASFISGFASLGLASFAFEGGSLTGCFAPPGLKYFSNPFGGFSQNNRHSFNKRLKVEAF